MQRAAPPCMKVGGVLMAEGYEQGRNASTADYKVYLHQDVFIVNRHFIEDIDAVFRTDDRIGIIGMLGNDEVRDQRLSWDKWKYGKVIAGNGREQMLVDYGEIRGQYREVDCLDGMVLVTRYDIPWREDIFINWHFYDRSICLEYKRRGYFCVVPRQEMPWCVHACGVGGLAGWSDSLRVYLDEYRDFFQADKVLENSSLPDGEALQRADLAADKLEELIDRTEQVAFHSGVMDMHRIPDETYDVIICFHVPEHVRDDRKVLGEWKRVLKPEGKTIFLFRQISMQRALMRSGNLSHRRITAGAVIRTGWYCLQLQNKGAY